MNSESGFRPEIEETDKQTENKKNKPFNPEDPDGAFEDDEDFEYQKPAASNEELEKGKPKTFNPDDPLGLFTDNPTPEQIAEAKKFRDILLEEMRQKKAEQERKLSKFLSRQVYIGKEVKNDEVRNEEQLSHLKMIDEVEKSVEGELEKTEQDRAIIAAVNEIIKKSFKDLGIDREVNLELPEFHFLSHEAYWKKFGEKSAWGFSRAALHAVYIDKERILEELGKWAFFEVVLHESVHQMSHIKNYLGNKFEKHNVTRVGYLTIKPGDNSKKSLEGFNEAVVQKFIKLSMYNNPELILETIRVGINEKIKSTGAYMLEMVILEKIIQVVADRIHINQSVFWNKIVEGEFTGEMMHLRVIDDVYGKGSLRVLSLLGNSVNGLSIKETEDYISAYFFAADDPEFRGSIRKALLGNIK